MASLELVFNRSPGKPRYRWSKAQHTTAIDSTSLRHRILFEQRDASDCGLIYEAADLSLHCFYSSFNSVLCPTSNLRSGQLPLYVKFVCFSLPVPDVEDSFYSFPFFFFFVSSNPEIGAVSFTWPARPLLIGCPGESCGWHRTGDIRHEAISILVCQFRLPGN